MARKLIETITDDIDKVTIGASTIQFAIEGDRFEIDLCPENADRLREALSPFIINGRPIITPRTRRRNSGKKLARDKARDIRAWAKTQGISVNPRGRISTSVIEQYESAPR